jgi:hypothetical protein
MTKNEAIERASKIWRTIDVTVHLTAGTWWVDAGPKDQTGRVHTLDDNGHVTCHDVCKAREDQAFPTVVDVKKCDTGMKLVRVTFIMQVGAGAPVKMVEAQIKKLLAADPVLLRRMLQDRSGMGDRTIASVRAEEVRS